MKKLFLLYFTATCTYVGAQSPQKEQNPTSSPTNMTQPKNPEAPELDKPSKKETNAYSPIQITPSNQETKSIQNPNPKVPPQILEKYDTNKNGKIEYSEIPRNAIPPVPPELRERFDKNKDGTIDKSEKESLLEFIKKQRLVLMEKFDKDKDGRLNSEERKDIDETLDLLSQKNKDRFDKNKDGEMDKEEIAYAVETLLKELDPENETQSTK